MDTKVAIRWICRDVEQCRALLKRPYTGDLYHVDWLNGCIVWLGTSFGMPLLLSVNTMILIQWMLMGLGTILLSKRLKLTVWGTLFVLCSLDTAPFIERFVLHSAVFERLNLGWLLLYLWCLLSLIQEKQWSYSICRYWILWTHSLRIMALCSICGVKQYLDWSLVSSQRQVAAQTFFGSGDRLCQYCLSNQ